DEPPLRQPVAASAGPHGRAGLGPGPRLRWNSSPRHAGAPVPQRSRHAVLCCDKSPAPRRRTAMSTTGTTPRTRAKRDPYLDNARGLLIALGVVGRTSESIETPGEALRGTLCMARFPCHMAALTMISGFLSRSYPSEPRQVRRLLSAMVVP